MATKYKFLYKDYLASNSTINQTFIQWLFEGEKMDASGASGISVKKHFPEIYTMIKDLAKLKKFPRSLFEELESLNIILIRDIAGDLWVTFTKKRLSSDPKVSMLVSGINIIIGMDKGDEGPSFKIKRR